MKMVEDKAVFHLTKRKKKGIFSLICFHIFQIYFDSNFNLMFFYLTRLKKIEDHTFEGDECTVRDGVVKNKSGKLDQGEDWIWS